MPDEAYWESLLDAPLILDRLGIDARLQDVVEMGCGYGTFTIPVARRISGVLTTIDIEQTMVERTRQRAAAAAVWNIFYVVRDVLADGFGVASASRDGCLLFNILHGEEPLRLLSEAARAVKPGGFVFVIHWRCDPATPRGPVLDIRPRPEQILEWAKQTNHFSDFGPVLDLPPWHYGVRLCRKEATMKVKSDF